MVTKWSPEEGEEEEIEEGEGEDPLEGAPQYGSMS
jgi:hypothetical protein